MAAPQTKRHATLVRLFAVKAQGASQTPLDFSQGSVFLAHAEASAGLGTWLQKLYVFALSVTRLVLSKGVWVDTFIEAFGMKRLGAVASTGPRVFARLSVTSQVVVPVGGTVATTDGLQTFTVYADPGNGAFNLAFNGYLILPGANTVSVPVQANAPGKASNVGARTIAKITSAMTGVDSVTNAVAFRFMPPATNTGPYTITIPGIGNQPLPVVIGPNTALSGGEIVMGRWAEVRWDGTSLPIGGATGSGSGVSTTNVKALASARNLVFSSQTAGTYTYAVPSDGSVARIFPDLFWGAGGGGGYNSGGGAPSGGASGAFNTSPDSATGAGYAVNPGDVVTIVIGAGGLGGAASPARAGQNGGDSYILINNTEVMRAGGGGGGLNGSASGGIANVPQGGVPTRGNTAKCQTGTPGFYGHIENGGAILGGDGAGPPGPGGGIDTRGGQGSVFSGSSPGGGGPATGNASYAGATGGDGAAYLFV